MLSCAGAMGCVRKQAVVDGKCMPRELRLVPAWQAGV